MCLALYTTMHPAFFVSATRMHSVWYSCFRCHRPGDQSAPAINRRREFHATMSGDRPRNRWSVPGVISHGHLVDASTRALRYGICGGFYISRGMRLWNRLFTDAIGPEMPIGRFLLEDCSIGYCLVPFSCVSDETRWWHFVWSGREKRYRFSSKTIEQDKHDPLDERFRHGG